MEENLKAEAALDAPASGSVNVPPTPSRPDSHTAFGNSIKDFPIFPDSCEALHALARHYKLVVLSNVDRESFAYTHYKLSEGNSVSFDSDSNSNNSRLPVYTSPYPQPWLPQSVPGTKSPFSLILTAQDVGSYKPALKGFEAALAAIEENAVLLNTPREKVLWVAQSVYHDIEPAGLLGVKSVWIDRADATMGLLQTGTGPQWSWKYETLGELAAAVEKETSSE